MEKKKKYVKPLLKRRIAMARAQNAQRRNALSIIDTAKVRIVLFSTGWDDTRFNNLVEIAWPELYEIVNDTSWCLDETDIQQRADEFTAILSEPRNMPVLDFVTDQLKLYMNSEGNREILRKIEKHSELFETSRVLAIGEHFLHRLVSDALGFEGDTDSDILFKLLVLALVRRLGRLDVSKLWFCQGCGEPYEQTRKNQKFHSTKCKQDFHNASRDKVDRKVHEELNRSLRDKLKGKNPKMC